VGVSVKKSEWIDYAILPKEYHQRFHRGETSFFIWVFLVGFIHVSLFVFDKTDEYFSGGVDVNGIVNVVFWGFVSLVFGYFALLVFSNPYYDMLQYLKKREAKNEKRVEDIFQVREKRRIVKKTKKNPFLTENQVTHDKNIEIVMKAFILYHIPVTLRLLIRTIIWFLGVESVHVSLELFVLVLVLIIPIWGVFILVRSVDLVGEFRNEDKPLLYLVAFAWIQIIELIMYRFIPRALDFLMVVE
jgi:hypothetical protein